MSLTGTIRPTFLYPRIKYGSPIVTFDNAEPTSRIPTLTPYTGLRGVNTVASGKREYLFGRAEEQVGLVLRCEQDQLAALRWFVQDYGATGAQFQTWVDRYTGSCWVLENNLKDQNGLALTLSTGSASYAAASTGTGLVLSGTQHLTVATAQATAATPTGYDDPVLASEGVLVVDFLPAFAGADATEHNIVAASQFRLYKNTANQLVFQTGPNAGDTVAGTVSWSASQRVQIVAEWFTDGTRALWLAVNNGAFTPLTTAAGSAATITLGATLFIGANTAAANRALGTYDTVAFFKRAFTTPQLTLANFRPVERNYFPYAELTAAAFQPVRVTLGRPIFDWALTVRNGVV